MQTKFNVELQCNDPSDNQTLGSLSAEQVQAQFKQIAWADLVAEIKEDDLSPTFYIQKQQGRYLWASVFGTPTEFDFVIEAVLECEIEQSMLFGLIKTKSNLVTINETYTLAQAEHVIALYVNHQHLKIYQHSQT